MQRHGHGHRRSPRACTCKALLGALGNLERESEEETAVWTLWVEAEAATGPRLLLPVAGVPAQSSPGALEGEDESRGQELLPAH